MKKFYMIRKQNLMVFAIFVFLMGILVGFNLQQQQIREVEKIVIAGEKIIELGIPAVDSEGNGVVGTLITRIRPGNGQVLVNVNDVLAQFDTQFSGRVAARAAANFTKIGISNLDIIYDIKVNATVIEGPSAGSTMATSIVLALEGIESQKNIMMTGTISEDGRVGSVGAILEKAMAAKEEGATIFIVPRGQSTQLESMRVRTCKTTDGIEICRIRYEYERVNIGQSLNLTVIEAGTLSAIVEIFRKNQINQTAE